MTTDTGIFSQPFKSDEKLRPSKEQLAAYRESNSGKDGDDLSGKDFRQCRRLLSDANAFDQKYLLDAKPGDLRPLIFHGVLRHSRFPNQALLSAVDLYRYQLHRLSFIDISTPASFIKSAEKTISRLDKKKINDALRIVRLQEMVAERKRIIEDLSRPSEAVVAELYRIALYIKDNLVRMELHCTGALAMLSDPFVVGKKIGLMIGDIKERPQKALREGKITIHDIDNANREVKAIADVLSSVITDDINALQGFYRSVLNRVNEAIRNIGPLPGESKKAGKSKNNTNQDKLLDNIGDVLISLLTAPFPEQRESIIGIDAAYELFITRKRREMLVYLFAVLQKNRRSLLERRLPRERRIKESEHKVSERRSSADRRTGKKRRNT